MSKGSALVLVGVLTLLLPISGLPVMITNWFLVLFGAITVGIGASLRMRKHAESAATPPVPAQVLPNEPHLSSIA